MLGSGRAHAATLNISGGCTLPIAINSVNAGANQSGCTATGSYGSSDTINIPSGTQTLSADLPNITQPVVIKGAGMAQTTIDGNGNIPFFASFTGTGSEEVSISDLKITGFKSHAIRLNVPSSVVERVEVDGANTVGTDLSAVLISRQAAGTTATVVANDIYIHNFSTSNTIVNGFMLNNAAQGITINATISNVTVSDIENSVGSINAFIVGSNTYGFSSGNATTNAQIYNTTISNLTAASSVAGFGAAAIAVANTSHMELDVQNVTITNIDGNSSPYGESAAFFAGGGGIGAGSVGEAIVNVQNSLIANNLNNGSPGNCANLDITAVFSGAGSGSGTINSLGHNISDDNTCTSFTEEGDQQNVGNIISTLGPLQNNGGAVPTMALLSGSPAIGAGGQVLGISTDARGIARSAGSWDVGAYQTVLGETTTNNGSESSGGSGNLADTGQRSKTNLVIGLLLISTALATVVSRRKLVYKRR